MLKKPFLFVYKKFQKNKIHIQLTLLESEKRHSPTGVCPDFKRSSSWHFVDNSTTIRACLQFMQKGNYFETCSLVIKKW